MPVHDRPDYRFMHQCWDQLLGRASSCECSVSGIHFRVAEDLMQNSIYALTSLNMCPDCMTLTVLYFPDKSSNYIYIYIVMQQY